jgi:hypothetical protein
MMCWAVVWHFTSKTDVFDGFVRATCPLTFVVDITCTCIATWYCAHLYMCYSSHLSVEISVSLSLDSANVER